MRYLTVIQVLDFDSTKPFDSAAMTGDNVVRVGDWSIKAGLEPAAPAKLEVTSNDGQAVLPANGGSPN